MTDAQWKVKTKQITKDVDYKLRKFRKECVTRGIVKFVNDDGNYELKYREIFVCYLFGDSEDAIKLRAVWSVIRIAEETIKKIEGVKHDC